MLSDQPEWLIDVACAPQVLLVPNLTEFLLIGSRDRETNRYTLIFARRRVPREPCASHPNPYWLCEFQRGK